MKPEDWDKPCRRFAFLLGGDAIPTPDQRGRRIVDDSLLIVINGDREDAGFRLPALQWAESWERVIDTEPEDRLSRVSTMRIPAGEPIELPPLSIAVFVGVRKE
jgi:glycogen operon protein